MTWLIIKLRSIKFIRKKYKSNTSNLQIFQHVNFPFLVCFYEAPNGHSEILLWNSKPWVGWLLRQRGIPQGIAAIVVLVAPVAPRYIQIHQFPLSHFFFQKPSKWHTLMNLQAFYCKSCILRILALLLFMDLFSPRVFHKLTFQLSGVFFTTSEAQNTKLSFVVLGCFQTKAVKEVARLHPKSEWMNTINLEFLRSVKHGHCTSYHLLTNITHNYLCRFPIAHSFGGMTY